jgi:HAD superfamily hydrolase (TIGR01509 family)
VPWAFSTVLRRLLLISALVVLAGCESAINVDVTVEEDGSGVVRAEVELDGAATTEIIDLGTVGLALGDLDDAGWETDAPQRLESGGLLLSASKAFGTPDQLDAIMTGISGSAGLFSDFELVRTKEFARVDYAMTGSIKPSGLEPFGDAELVELMGRSIEEMAVRYGATAADVSVTLRVELPGDPRLVDESTGEAISGDETTVRVWETSLDASGPTAVSVASSTRTVAALVWRGVAVLAAVLAGLVLLGELLRLLRPQNRRKKRPSETAKAKSKPRSAPVVPAEDSVIDNEAVSTTPVVVALDGMGVLYREGNDIHQILVPFAREMGSRVTDDEIIARSRALSLGRMTTADFWRSLEIVGDTDELDDAYLARHQLNPGVIKFLRTLRDQGVQVACITNDATTWANKLKVRHSLGGLIDPWILSGAVGVRKPDRPIFEVLRRVTGQPPSLIMVVDDDLANLDAARELGYRTAWFSPGATVDESNGHAILRSFEVSTPAE